MMTKQEIPLSSRCHLPRRTLVALCATSAVIASYMLYEAQWLQFRRLELPLAGLPSALAGTRILHVSDLHAGALGPGRRALYKFVATARNIDPDLVLFTGDMTDKKKDLEPYIHRLGEVRARYGKFAVLGNHDHGLRKTVLQDLALKLLGRDIREKAADAAGIEYYATVERNRMLLKQAGIELLENQCRVVELAGVGVQVCGIDDYQYGYGDLAAAREQFDPAAGLRILLSHSPDAVARVDKGDYQLVLAGHTHGGQICIPRPGGKILLSSSGSKYGDGVYQKEGATLHVSRGVGTTLLPFRLFSRPEVTLLELRPDRTASG